MFTCHKIPSRRRARQGVSLVELVMVVLIVGVATAIAVPRWATTVQKYQVNNAANKIVADLTRVQAGARHRSASLTISFNTATEQYTVVGLTDPDHPAATYMVNLAFSPYNANLVSANFGGLNTLTFNGFGVPSAGGTVVVAAGPYSKTVAVDATTGVAAIQ